MAKTSIIIHDSGFKHEIKFEGSQGPNWDIERKYRLGEECLELEQEMIKDSLIRTNYLVRFQLIWNEGYQRWDARVKILRNNEIASNNFNCFDRKYFGGFYKKDEAKAWLKARAVQILLNLEIDGLDTKHNL